MGLVEFLVGLIIGGVAGWFVAYRRFGMHAPGSSAERIFREQLDLADRERVRAEERSTVLQQHLDRTTAELSAERERVVQLSATVSGLQIQHESLQEKLETHRREVEGLQQQFVEQFQAIAHKILLDNSRLIQQEHKESLGNLLTPLKEKIETFEQKVDQTHKESIRDSESLKEQILNLQKLNQSIGEEARNLTTALKGQAKVRGMWGEIVLERILEHSGLVKGREYVVQTTTFNDEGRRFQPDVIVRLPENRSLIIDAKVSLNAYDRYCAAENDVQRELALKEHIASVRRHIKDLSQKGYQGLEEFNSPDFVFMFIPIEPAFHLAVQHDMDLCTEAVDMNVHLVSPLSLWASLRMVANLWNQDRQNRNALEIARQGGELYDKFVAFVEDLVDLGRKMDQARKSYDDAMAKLVNGRGNLVRRAEEMKALGAKASRALPASVTERAHAEDLRLFE